MEDQAAGMGPHRLGFPERLSRVRALSVDQPEGIVDTSLSELRSSEVRVERLDQEAGRVPPRDGDLHGAISESSEMGNSGQWGEAGSSHLLYTLQDISRGCGSGAHSRGSADDQVATRYCD